LGEIRPVPDLVAGHLKANLFYARFDGHAADEEALGRTTTRAWVNDVVEAVAIGERIGERVIIMATSTGAALATWALGEPALARRVAAVVMLSPNYKLQSRGGWLLASPFARQIIRLALGRTRVIEPRNDLHARFWTIRYPTDALLPLTGAMQLANRTKFEEINVPALFAYSPDDDLVDPRRTLQIAGRWGAPNTLVTVPATPLSSHVLAGDALAPGNTVSVTRTVCDWLDRTLSR
jgi:alpha-beta hydrolase superfamily lysophospholipase